MYSKLASLFGEILKNSLLAVPQITAIRNTNLWIIYFFAVFMCLGINAFWSMTTGKFFPSDEFHYNFLQDIPDLINYIVVVPGYFVTGVMLIKTNSEILEKPSETGCIEYDPNLLQSKFPSLFGILFWYVLIAGGYTFFVISNYSSEFLKNDLIWWCLDRINGKNVLTLHGHYYIAMNAIIQFWLLVLVLEILKACYVSNVIFKKARINPLWHEVHKGFPSIKKSFYIGLFLTVLVMINLITWSVNEGTYIKSLNISKVIFHICLLVYFSSPIIVLIFYLSRASKMEVNKRIEDVTDPVEKIRIASEARKAFNFIPFSGKELAIICFLLSPIIAPIGVWLVEIIFQGMYSFK